MSGGPGSYSKDGVSLGMYLSPVNVNAPDSLRNLVRAAIPLGMPSTRGGRSTDAGCQICHESLTVAISEPQHHNSISTHTDTSLQDVQM